MQIIAKRPGPGPQGAYGLHFDIGKAAGGGEKDRGRSGRSVALQIPSRIPSAPTSMANNQV